MLDLTEIAEQIAALPLSTAIRTSLSWRWLFPTIESVHVVAITTVFGSILFLDLRLLGFAQAGTRVSRVMDEMLPLTWMAFVLAVISGTLLFMANAPDYVVSLQFGLKMVCILLAGLNMAVFQWGAGRRIPEWDTQLPPPAAARIAGGLSILFWISAVFFGRWVGFVEVGW